jgi:uncharacterized protein
MTPDYPEDNLIIDLAIDTAEKKAAYPNIKQTVTLFFLLLVNTLAVIIVAGIVLHGLTFKSPPLKLIIYIAPLLVTINSARRRLKKQGDSLKINFNKIPLWLIPLVIIGAVALIVPLSQTSSWIPMPLAMQKMFKDAFTKNIFSIVTAVIAAPVLEEILCRGIVLKGLLENYKPYKAIVISALFFSAIHLNPWQGIPAFFDGLFLGWVYYKTQSVIPGMIIHATINLTASLFLFLPNPEQYPTSLMGTGYFFAALFASLLVFVAVCVIIHKKIRAEPA